MDYAAATPVLPEVRDAMEKYFSKDFYNPNAIYQEGVRVKKDLGNYKTQIAALTGARKEGIIFTSGGTEANVLAMRGARPLTPERSDGGRVKNTGIFIEEGSHPSVVEASKGLAKSPTWEVATLISSTTRDNTQGKQVREYRKKNGTSYPLLHIDASQTIQYWNVGLEALSCDLISLDASKLYGPKGVGALVVRRGVELDLPPEGTRVMPLIAGFAKALEVAVRDRESEYRRLNSLSAQFKEMLESSLPQAIITQELPNITLVSVPGILPELLVLALDREGILVSAGPACDFHKPEPRDTPVRFSFGRFTTVKEVIQAAKTFCSVVGNLLKSDSE
ncbi:MAG TPA: aminotransferase class V-fold PLP-dependent enzyme [Candidatus Paceibacterota bacterium]